MDAPDRIRLNPTYLAPEDSVGGSEGWQAVAFAEAGSPLQRAGGGAYLHGTAVYPPTPAGRLAALEDARDWCRRNHPGYVTYVG